MLRPVTYALGSELGVRFLLQHRFKYDSLVAYQVTQITLFQSQFGFQAVIQKIFFFFQLFVPVVVAECVLYLDNRVFRHCINQSESRQGRNEFHIFLVSILIG